MRAVLKTLLVFIFLSAFSSNVLAESKPNLGPGQVIPKLPKTADDPILENGGVYPMWGPPCQRYTYHTTYRDKKGRAPEYVKMYFNGKYIDVSKLDSNDNDYKKGVTYAYEFIPNKIGPNFFFFEASNGVGKTREGIIDSPGNGPVLFEADFLHNQIVLIEKGTGRKVIDYPTGSEWVGGVALSGDGKYLAVKTSAKVIFFDTTKPSKPLWVYGAFEDVTPGMVGGDVKGGIAISQDGSKIFASVSDLVLLFDKKSNKPIWKYNVGNAYNVGISGDGNYMAAATAGTEENENTNLIVLWSAKSSKPLWQYHASGNFHDVTLSYDGRYIAGATGCPDRRAYIFERSSNNPLLKSEPLTYDSPVSRSKIASDGSLAVFNTDGGPNSSMVILFSNKSKTPLWKFSSSETRASRALGITPDGKYTGAANMNGEVYLFENESNHPLKEWKLGAAVGAFDISDDGNFLAAGGTDNKLYVLEKDGSKRDFTLNEFVQEIDISSNGKYIAVGTGGSHYFFEEVYSPNQKKIFDCSKAIEPEISFSQMTKRMDGGNGNGSSDFAKRSENEVSKNSLSLFEKIVSFFQRIFGFRVARDSAPGGSPDPREETGAEGECGNTICEPNMGETKQNCPKDCSGEN